MLFRSLANSGHSPHRSESQLSNIKFAQLDVAEIDPEEVFIHLLKTQVFKGEHLAYEDPVLVPTDVSATVHSPRYEASWISELDRCSRKHDGAALIEARGCFVLQPLMRAFG
jgi:hypothetical protein